MLIKSLTRTGAILVLALMSGCANMATQNYMVNAEACSYGDIKTVKSTASAMYGGNWSPDACLLSNLRDGYARLDTIRYLVEEHNAPINGYFEYYDTTPFLAFLSSKPLVEEARRTPLSKDYKGNEIVTNKEERLAILDYLIEKGAEINSPEVGANTRDTDFLAYLSKKGTDFSAHIKIYRIWETNLSQAIEFMDNPSSIEVIEAF